MKKLLEYGFNASVSGANYYKETKDCVIGVQLENGKYECDLSSGDDCVIVNKDCTIDWIIGFVKAMEV